MNLYLFNPENDLAIAFGGENYTPPPAAQLIGKELSALPLWYADDDSTIYIPDKLPSDFLHTLAPFHLKISTVTPDRLDGAQVKQIHVWGWNRDLIKRLRLAGIDKTLLPSARQCDTIRELSHRKFSAEIGEYLRNRIDYPFPELPVELHTADEIRSFTEQSDRKILKAPWSGSGRGLYWNLYGYDTALAQWSNGVLQKQGMLMGEPVYDKVSDWAMEFHSDGSEVKFAGYSSFLTDRHGAYKENRLASDAVLELQLTHAVGLEIITAVKKSLIDFFTERIAPYYTGYFGVDIMAYRDKRGNTLLHPFVELNLRMNMGMVARKLADRFLPPETEGRYRVDYYPKPGELHNDHIARLKTNPPRITDGKLLRGYLALTPVSPHSRYRASIEI